MTFLLVFQKVCTEGQSNGQSKRHRHFLSCSGLPIFSNDFEILHGVISYEKNKIALFNTFMIYLGVNFTLSPRRGYPRALKLSMRPLVTKRIRLQP
jgi:hypothetical protein